MLSCVLEVLGGKGSAFEQRSGRLNQAFLHCRCKVYVDTVCNEGRKSYNIVVGCTVR
jgi:hypothetical protein